MTKTNTPTTSELLRVIRDYYSPLISSLELIRGGDRTPEEGEELEKMYSRLVSIRDSWEEAEREYQDTETPEDRKREIRYSVEEWYSNLLLLHSVNGNKYYSGEMKVPEYRIIIDPETGERRQSTDKTYLWGDKYFVPGEGILEILSPGETVDLLAEVENIRKSSKGGVVKISKDLWKSQIEHRGDALEFIKDERIRRTIQRKSKEGKYIAGTLIGLSGGERYFKLFCLALSQTLNEQSKYYHTQDDLSGVPKDLITRYAGEGAIVESIKDPTSLFKGGLRPYPIIFIIWEDIAKKMSATGEISGGKDIKQVRDYVLGGTAKRKDKKTGREKEIFVPGLLGREYLIEGEKGIIGVPLMTKILSLYPKDSPDKEIGIAVQLSPLFALKNLIGYTGIRPDTIQLLGGGKQRELTINLFIFLAYYRGVPPQTGRKRGEFVQRKRELLPEISRGLSSYTGRPGLLEKHFKEAIQRCIDAKILLSGKTKTGLRGYREELSPGKEILSVFVYNPDYLKGEEINLFSEVEDQ